MPCVRHASARLGQPGTYGFAGRDGMQPGNQRQSKMEKQLTCTICNQRFEYPKLLPCLHCFCRDCIDLLRVQGRNTFHCPECGRHGGADVKIPENGAQDLPDAYPIHHRIELSRFVDMLASNEVNPCDACARASKQKVAAVSFCTTCSEHICKGCLKKHELHFELSDHVLVAYDELAKSKDLSQHKDVLRRSRSYTAALSERCHIHRDEKLIKYCFDCSTLICLTCAKTNHREHNTDLIDVSAEKRKRELRNQLPGIRTGHKRLDESLDGIRKVRTSIEDQRQSLSAFIDNEFDRLHKTIDRHRAKLHSSLTGIADGKIHRTTEQLLKAEGASAELKRLEQFTEDTLDTTTENELLQFYSFLQEKIADTTRRSGKVSVTPVETPNLAIKSSCGSYLSEFLHKHMAVYCLQADPSKCMAEGPGLKEPETLRVAQFNVHVLDKNSKPCTFPQDIIADIKCVRTDAKDIGEVHDSGKGFYTVSFSPTLRGQHVVRVLVNDHHIRGSPFSINVRHCPSQLGKSQGVKEGVKSPRGIAINSAGHLLVTEWNDGRIVEYDQQGQQIQSFGHTGKNSRKLCHPSGIVTDEAGSVYVADAAGEQSCIVKYTSRGVQVAEVGKEGSEPCQFQNPRGIALNPITGELYVCDRDNHRLQVFNADLKFIRCLNIGSVDKHLLQQSKPNDVTFDAAGNMYVADYANNCIMCFAPNSLYLSSFSKQGTEPGCLSGPECVHVDKYGYLYVSEYKNHRVSVFNSSHGRLVTHFGRLGSGEGELKFPMGLVTDSNGFVYVCELFNHRIQLF